MTNDIRLSNTFKDLSFIPKLYIVGGAVRDFLMKVPIVDIDTASENIPSDIISLCEKNNVSYYLTGMDHGTITIVVNGISYEHTTFRKESLNDGRHAEVVFTESLEEDAARRDFTINAMYIDNTGTIIDLYGGAFDIISSELRCVGNAEIRMKEDYLRIIRAIRFSVMYCLGMDAALTCAIIKYADCIKALSIERIVQEIEKAFKHDNAGFFISSLRTHGLLKYILPELEDMWMFEQNPHYHPEVYVGVHICEVVEACEPKYRMHALLHDIGKRFTKAPHKTGDWSTYYGHDYIGAQKVGDICKRLKLSNNITKEIEMVCKYHMMVYTIKKESKLRKLAFEIQGFEEPIKAVFKADHPDNVWPKLPEIPKFPNGEEIHHALNIPLNTKQIGDAMTEILNDWISNGITDTKQLLNRQLKRMVNHGTKKSK